MPGRDSEARPAAAGRFKMGRDSGGEQVGMAEVWGSGTFDNAGARQFVETLEDAPDLEPLEELLDEVLEMAESGEPPDERLSTSTVAVAETIAALAQRPANDLPEEVRQWCFDNPGLDLSEVQPKAVQALGVILMESELRRVQEDSGLLPEWESEVEALRDRLQE
jgi:hypothetical protein